MDSGEWLAPHPVSLPREKALSNPLQTWLEGPHAWSVRVEKKISYPKCGQTPYIPDRIESLYQVLYCSVA